MGGDSRATAAKTAVTQPVPGYLQSSRRREKHSGSGAGGRRRRHWKLPFSQRHGQSACPRPVPGCGARRGTG